MPVGNLGEPPDPHTPVPPGFEVGLFVRGFTYDGVGRLIRTVSPWPSPELSGGEVRVERYFYDGVRRISEVVTDPMESLALAMSSGGEGQTEAQQAYAAEPELEGESLPVSVQQGQEGGGGGGSGGQNSSSSNPQTPMGGMTLSREYIWGPGDVGLDELLVQFGVSREAAWPVHDAGGDLIALCDTGGAGGSARLAGEWTHDAYGNVVTAAAHHTFAEPRLGHKGLFIERLDGGVIDPATGYEAPRLEPGATTLAFARNRHLHTAFGRWLQEDPNATGMSVLAVHAYHGVAPGSGVDGADVADLYRDGAVLSMYVDCNPLRSGDPLGLLFKEDLEDVVLQQVEDVDSLMPVSAFGPLNELLRGYAALGYIFGFYQGAAFDTEELIDWAGDMSAPDDLYSGGSVADSTSVEIVEGPMQAAVVVGAPTLTPRPRLNPIRMQGVGAERRARSLLGAKPMRRMINGRYYDGVGKGKSGSPLGKGVLLEVKDSVNGVNGRVMKQLNKDAALIRTRGKRIHWHFELKKGQSLTPHLDSAIRSRGITISIVHR